LCECHAEKLIAAGEIADAIIASIAIDALVEFVPQQKIGKAPTAYEQRVVPAARATGADDEVRACVLLVERLLRFGMIRISFPV
jgi:hypothetical protein